MKAKLLAQRLRARSDELHRHAITYQGSDTVAANHARLLADALQEVADQVAPPQKEKKKR